MVARALALFLGGFSMLNLLGELRHQGFDTNLWWIDFRPLPAIFSRAVLFFASVALIAYALEPRCGTWRWRLTTGAILCLLIAALWNIINFYLLALRERIQAGFPMPFSLLVSADLVIVLISVLRRTPGPAGPVQWTWAMVTLLACLVGFPLAQMLCFGKTDYRRPADVIVVLGARVYVDGRPSLALADRVRTACQLYQEGFARKLIFSGGPGDGPVHETETMRRMAMEAGIRPEDILLDPEGADTQATVKNSIALFQSLDAKRVLVVSHFYHLPRVKMAFQRSGWEVFTVPAQETRVLVKLPMFMLREIAALWVYYLRPLGSVT